MSPALTTYILLIDSSIVGASTFTFNFLPIDKKLLDKLFISFSLSTVKLYFLAILYNVSPALTV